MGSCFSLDKDDDDTDSKSMSYKATGASYEAFATFGAGCYWGTEKYFVNDFQ